NQIVHRGTAPAVKILVFEGHEAFVEEGIALARDLDPGGVALVVAEQADLLPACRGIDTDDLPVAAEFAHRDHQRHEMDVKSALRVLARITQLQEVKDGPNVGIEAIIALAGKGSVTIAEVGNGLAGVTVET